MMVHLTCTRSTRRTRSGIHAWDASSPSRAPSKRFGPAEVHTTPGSAPPPADGGSPSGVVDTFATPKRSRTSRTSRPRSRTMATPSLPTLTAAPTAAPHHHRQSGRGGIAILMPLACPAPFLFSAPPPPASDIRIADVAGLGRRRRRRPCDIHTGASSQRWQSSFLRT